MAPGTTKPYRPPEIPQGTINTTDLESRVVRTRRGFMQGYTAQAVSTEGQIVVCAEVICRGNERRSLQGLVDDTDRELERAGVSGQYRQRKDHYIQMREQLASDEGSALYQKRKTMIEPIFGQIKHNRRIDRFTRCGLAACRAEWRLVMATHNLLKLYNHQIATG